MTQKKDFDLVSVGKGLAVILAVVGAAGIGGSTIASNDQSACTVAEFQRHASIDSMKWQAQSRINVLVDSLDYRTRRMENLLTRIDERMPRRRQ